MSYSYHDSNQDGSGDSRGRKKIIAINGSYRDNGKTDQAVEAVSAAARERGANVEVILLRNTPIEFCLNCRECTQPPGTAPVPCVQHDAMNGLVEKIEAADAIILASPTNFYGVTALFKRFMERLIVYTYWPWGQPAPKLRQRGTPQKKALLISSSAAPGFIARRAFITVKQLKMTAKTVGAKPVGTLFTGLASGRSLPALPDASKRKIKKLVERLVG